MTERSSAVEKKLDDAGLNDAKLRIVPCNFSSDAGVHLDVTNSSEGSMLSCDYNGWADMPEEEREAIDAFEYSEVAPISSVLVFGREPAVVQVPPPELQAA